MLLHIWNHEISLTFLTPYSLLTCHPHIEYVDIPYRCLKLETSPETSCKQNGSGLEGGRGILYQVLPKFNRHTTSIPVSDILDIGSM